MPSPAKSKRVKTYATERGWSRIGEPEWNELRSALPGIAEEILRKALPNVDAPWCGVKQHALGELEESLNDFTRVYAARPDLQRHARDLVIEAKDHARLASRNARVDPVKRALKAEMVEWMLVWLGDPAVFPAWAALRLQQFESGHAKIGSCSNTSPTP